METAPGTKGYAAALPRFIKATESIDFHDLNGCFLDFLPSVPGSILDAGAGTGRDAAAFAAMGHRVSAVEPTHEFLEAAKTLHPFTPVQWICDSLPHLTSLADRRFDFVLCQGVWQHLNKDERVVALVSVAALLEPGGTLALTLRHGPPGVGTHYFPADADETVGDATRVGLHEVLRLDHQPSLVANKLDVTWTRLAFRKAIQPQ